MESFDEVDCMVFRAEDFSCGVEALVYLAMDAWIVFVREVSISIEGSKGGGP